LIHQEIWTNIGSTSLSALTGHADYPKRPKALRALNGFDTGVDRFGENYGSRIRTWVTPPETGLYTFFLAADDESQLKFSFNADGTDAVIIAWADSATGHQEWTRYSSQQSGDKWLVAGERYYLETINKQSSGPDHLAVGWAGPGLFGTNVIAASFLTPVDLEYPPELTNGSVNLSLAATNGTHVAAFTAADSPLDTLTYRILSGNLSNTFSLDPATGRLVVQDNTPLAGYAVTNFNLLIQVQDSGYGGLYPLKSAQAALKAATTAGAQVRTGMAADREMAASLLLPGDCSGPTVTTCSSESVW
jgi:hypothetical protein